MPATELQDASTRVELREMLDGPDDEDTEPVEALALSV